MTRGWSTTPRWYFWDGGFFVLGSATGVVPAHEHHAIQITLTLDGMVRFAGADGEWQEMRGAIIRPDVIHSMNASGGPGVLVFVDPETAEGRWLGASLVKDITRVPETRVEQCVGPIRTFADNPLEAMDPGGLIRHCVRALCAGAPPTRRLDPRIVKALDSIGAADDLKISLEDAAAAAFLSPSRFAHLFTEHVGLPFRRYLLWRKLTRALMCIGRGQTNSEAAHTAGFADAAHMTRTFNQMFGIPPSLMMRGDSFVIPSPFAAEPESIAR